MNNENEKQELVNSINILLLEKKELNDELNRINKRRLFFNMFITQKVYCILIQDCLEPLHKNYVKHLICH
jgi:hypothetical protein